MSIRILFSGKNHGRSRHSNGLHILLLLVVACFLTAVTTGTSNAAFRSRSLLTKRDGRLWSIRRQARLDIRGGADSIAVDSDEEDSDEEDSDEDLLEESSDEEEELEEESEEEDEAALVDEEDEYDEESPSSEEDESEVVQETETEESAASEPEESAQVEESEYDAVLTIPPMQQMALTIGIMFYSRKIDFSDPTVIRWARISFLSYIILTQIFLIYVRTRARQMGDTTPITQPVHPLLSSLLPPTAPTLAKDLASKLLSTQNTIMEYDIAQSKAYNNKLLFPLLFTYFLHFKLKQVQPLIYQAASGLLQLVYSPLWQVYVLGRNLERPFRMHPSMPVEQQGEDEVTDEPQTKDIEPVESESADSDEEPEVLDVQETDESDYDEEDDSDED